MKLLYAPVLKRRIVKNHQWTLTKAGIDKAIPPTSMVPTNPFATDVGRKTEGSARDAH